MFGVASPVRHRRVATPRVADLRGMDVQRRGGGVLGRYSGPWAKFVRSRIFRCRGFWGVFLSRRVCSWAVGVAPSRGECVPDRRRRRAAGAGRRDDVGSERAAEPGAAPPRGLRDASRGPLGPEGCRRQRGAADARSLGGSRPSCHRLRLPRLPRRPGPRFFDVWAATSRPMVCCETRLADRVCLALRARYSTAIGLGLKNLRPVVQ